MKVKFGTANSKPIEWHVIKEGIIRAKEYLTDEALKTYLLIDLFPVANLKQMTADDVHKLVHEGGNTEFNKFCSEALLGKFFNREEQESLVRTIGIYSYSKNLPWHMHARKPSYQLVKQYEDFGLVNDESGNTAHTYIGAVGDTLTYADKFLNRMFNETITPDFKGDELLSLALRPIVQIAITKEEYDRIKVSE